MVRARDLPCLLRSQEEDHRSHVLWLAHTLQGHLPNRAQKAHGRNTLVAWQSGVPLPD
jgi:hypothetical protein